VSDFTSADALENDPYFNPYQAPKVGSVQRSPFADDFVMVWREGDVLVMERSAMLPDRCVKCNAPANGYKLWRNLSWHSPVYFLLVLLSPLIYIVVALIVRKTATIAIGLCETHRKKRRTMIAVAWLLFLASIASFFVAVQFDPPIGPSIVIAGIVVMLTSLVMAAMISQIVKPVNIDYRFVRLRGVGADFLDTLPTPGFGPRYDPYGKPRGASEV
jgi:hypothetical protein